MVKESRVCYVDGEGLELDVGIVEVVEVEVVNDKVNIKGWNRKEGLA